MIACLLKQELQPEPQRLSLMLSLNLALLSPLVCLYNTKKED